jgi:thioredoxin reductase (NADPH)
MIDLVIIGGGPAGISAFIEAKRLGLKTVVIEKLKIGGAVSYARRIDNFPPLSPISGKELALLLEQRFYENNPETIMDEVLEILPARNDGDLSRLILKRGEPLNAKAVILAAGQKDFIPLELKAFEGLLTLPGKCDAENGARVIIYGGGDVALDQALFLKEHGAEVEIFCRACLKAKTALISEARENGIKINEGYTLVSLEKQGKVIRSFFEDHDKKSFAGESIHVIAALGKVPSPPKIGGYGFADILKAGFSDHGGSSALKGLFIAGDLRRGRDRNIAVALGDGILAASGVFGYLKGEQDEFVGSR